jgi:hypothetical protein
MSSGLRKEARGERRAARGERRGASGEGRAASGEGRAARVSLDYTGRHVHTVHIFLRHRRLTMLNPRL